MSVQKVRLLTLAYFVFAVALRFVPHGVNFTAIGALALFAGCYLSVGQGMLLGLGAMALSDTLGHFLDIENISFYHRPTMMAVYAGFALPSLLGWALRRPLSRRSASPEATALKAFGVPAAAVASSVLFFVITNFAAWLDPMMGYELTLAGLAKCYIAAIPFAGNHFLGMILFSCAFFGIYAYMARLATSPALRNIGADES
jgi:hypothetical protein